MPPENTGDNDVDKHQKQIKQRIDGGGCTETLTATNQLRSQKTRRNFLTALTASAAAPIPITITGGADRHTPENVDGVEPLEGKALTEATIQALADHRVRILSRVFLKKGFKPRLRNVSGVKLQNNSSGVERTVTIPFKNRRPGEDAWLQHSTNPEAEPGSAVGFQTLRREDNSGGGGSDPYYDVEIYRVTEDDGLVRRSDRVGNLFGCPNDQVNPKGVTQLAADYAVTFVSCAGCIGSSTVFVPSCALCLAQISRMGVSLEDYDWCECEPTKNC